MPSKYFSIQGIATYLRHTGPTTLPEKPPELSGGEVLLCLHHAGGHCRNFDGLASALGDRHDSVAFDLPGHDRTASAESLGSIEAMGDFVAAFLERIEIDRPVILLGHGMGGAVALQCALEHSDRVRGLVLCGAGAGFPCDDDLIERSRLVSEGKARREFDIAAFKKGAAPDVLKAGYMDTLKTDPRVIHPNLCAWRDWKGGERVADLGLPILVCVGEEEKPRVVEHADALVRNAAQARKVVIDDAGHMIPHENPVGLAAAVEEFLGALP